MPLFFHSAKHFRLPEDKSLPIIMVGPGTGIAPFRAYLQERKLSGATGKNWLFFGDQRAEYDYLYREEFEEMQAAGVLHELSVAFSRDQAEKVYVQHRMMENGGGALPVAGGRRALLRVRRREPHGQGRGRSAAQDRGERTAARRRTRPPSTSRRLKKVKRYKRDVY